ncbi:MAG: NADPH:quinone oxidoreductase family protein [Pseudomonadota bacterium]|nr:NADPH:quinone oxidoreductase family protein [Pseudomonadota bacterium]
MRAILCKDYGPPESLVLEDIEPPTAGENDVVIKVHNAAVNYPDVLVIQNLYQIKPPLPFSPGGEISGEVIASGDKVDTLKIGDRVMAVIGTGGFREEIAVPAALCMPIPDSLDFKIAAAMGLTYGTSYHALKDRARIQAGETLFIMGASCVVGLAAVELGKSMGARVIAAASSEDKLQVCRDHGADDTLLYKTGGLSPDEQQAFSEEVKNLTDGKGVDVVYDAIGGDYAEPAVRAMAWGGRYLVVGFVAGYIPKIPLNLTLLKGTSLVGVFWGRFNAEQPKDARQNIIELMGMLQAGKIKPHISGVYPLEDAAIALTQMAERKVTGKLVVDMGR